MALPAQKFLHFPFPIARRPLFRRSRFTSTSCSNFELCPFCVARVALSRHFEVQNVVFCVTGTVMKNRASYTLEIFKIFIFSFFHFGYHCIHHFFIIYFIIFIFYHFRYHCFIIFYHFYHFLSVFYHFFNHFSSFFLPVVQKLSKKWKITIFLELFHLFIIFSNFFIMFLSFLLPVVELMKNQKLWKLINKNDKQMIKNEKETRGKLQFSSRFFSFFHFFIIFFNIFHHFCFQWCKNFPGNGKLQFSSSFFIFLACFYHFCFQWWN